MFGELISGIPRLGELRDGICKGIEDATGNNSGNK